MPDRPNLRPGPLSAGKRVIRVRRTIVFEPQHCAEMRAWILSLIADVSTIEADRRIAAVADTEQQAIVRQPDHSGTEVLAAGLGIGILEDDLRVTQGMPVKASTGKSRAIRSRIADG